MSQYKLVGSMALSGWQARGYWQYMCCHLHRTCKNVPSLWFIKDTSMIHINIGMKNTTYSVCYEKWKMLVWIHDKKNQWFISILVWNIQLVVSVIHWFKIDICPHSACNLLEFQVRKNKTKNASNTTALYRQRRYQL